MMKALIFDFDGLILDTETTEYRSFQQLAEPYGLELSIEMWHQWVGTLNGRSHAMSYVYEQIQQSHGVIEMKSLESTFFEIFETLIAKQEILPGVHEMIQQAKKHQLLLAIASSSQYDWVSHFLKKHHLIEYFDHIQTRDNVQHVKPHPEIYLTALQHLKIHASDAIAFEDSSVGSRAAKAAGLYCIVVPNIITAQQNFDHVDLVVESMAQLTIQDLQKLKP
jgi:putative hydrolase of the HAD superfamily